jgi:hypothetical protein
MRPIGKKEIGLIAMHIIEQIDGLSPQPMRWPLGTSLA